MTKGTGTENDLNRNKRQGLDKKDEHNDSMNKTNFQKSQSDGRKTTRRGESQSLLQRWMNRLVWQQQR